MSSADAYYNRFADSSSTSKNNSNKDSNHQELSNSNSHTDFDFPDLDAGQYISSKPPPLPSSLSQPPSADLPSFPEFSAFDAPSSFLNDKNSFSQYLSSYDNGQSEGSSSGAAGIGSAAGGMVGIGSGSSNQEIGNLSRQSEDVARLEAAASSIEESSEESGTGGQQEQVGRGGGAEAGISASGSSYSNNRNSIPLDQDDSAPSSAYQSPEQVLRQPTLPPSNKPQPDWSSQSNYSQPGRSSVTSHRTKGSNPPYMNQLDLNGRGGRTPEPGMYPLGTGIVGSTNTEIEDDQGDDRGRERARPNSFFGMDRPSAAISASGQEVPLAGGYGGGEEYASARSGLNEGHSEMAGGRPSSFFGVDSGSVPSSTGFPQPPPQAEPSQSAKIAAHHRGEPVPPSFNPGPSSNSIPISNGMSNGGLGPASTPSGRPASIAPSVSGGALLDHSHLKPGQSAALLSHGKTLELYRQNAKKTNDPDLIYEFAVFMIDASKSMGGEDASPKPGAAAGPTSYGNGDSPNPGAVDTEKEELVREAIGLLKKITERGHPDAQYFLADCYANGIGTLKGKQDFDKAYPLFVLAAKHGHADASYRAATCYEKGWGCRKDPNKAVQFYRKAASQSHPGSMYRLATAELNGELGLKKSAREGVKWLKRSAEAATPEFPHALHELALLHERGIDNLIFVDPEYACELLAQAGEMGYAPSAYKLGVNYEYGRMGCPQDGGLSIHMYNIAAQQNHKEACFALTAWYLVGSPGILPQSDTEAYLWAKKAAEQGMAKAEYAVGYFTEMGIGTVKDVTESRAWYLRAAEHGDRRANQRLAALSGAPVPSSRSPPTAARPAARPDITASAYDQGRMAAASNSQNPIYPFPGSAPPASAYPSPNAMRETQTAQRSQAKEAAIAETQWRQSIASAQNGGGRRASNGGQGQGQPGRSPRSSQPPNSKQQSSSKSRERPVSNVNAGVAPRKKGSLPPGAAGGPAGAYPSYPAEVSTAPPPMSSPNLGSGPRASKQMRSPPSSTGHSFNSQTPPPQQQGMYAAQMGSPAAFGSQAPGIRQWDAAAIGQAMNKAPSPAGGAPPAAAAGGDGKKKGWFGRN